MSSSPASPKLPPSGRGSGAGGETNLASNHRGINQKKNSQQKVNTVVPEPKSGSANVSSAQTSPNKNQNNLSSVAFHTPRQPDNKQPNSSQKTSSLTGEPQIQEVENPVIVAKDEDLTHAELYVSPLTLTPNH